MRRLRVKKTEINSLKRELCIHKEKLRGQEKSRSSGSAGEEGKIQRGPQQSEMQQDQCVMVSAQCEDTRRGI